MVSNILAGTQEQIETVITDGFFSILKDVFFNDVNSVKKEAVWAICNLANNKNPYFAEILVEEGIIEILCRFLFHKDPKTVIISLEAIEAFIEIDSMFFQTVKLFSFLICITNILEERYGFDWKSNSYSRKASGYGI
jgi:hypothetical protein